VHSPVPKSSEGKPKLNCILVPDSTNCKSFTQEKYFPCWEIILEPEIGRAHRYTLSGLRDFPWAGACACLGAIWQRLSWRRWGANTTHNTHNTRPPAGAGVVLELPFCSSLLAILFPRFPHPSSSGVSWVTGRSKYRSRVHTP
jgi:hypothetical protein